MHNMTPTETQETYYDLTPGQAAQFTTYFFMLNGNEDAAIGQCQEQLRAHGHNVPSTAEYKAFAKRMKDYMPRLMTSPALVKICTQKPEAGPVSENVEEKGLVIVEGESVPRLSYKGKAVVTLPYIDRLHHKTAGTAKLNFWRNRKKFILGVDYLESGDCVTESNPINRSRGGKAGISYLITKSGYAMLVKSFKDERSWRVQRALVDRYFQVPSHIEPAPQPFRSDNTPERWASAPAADKFLMTQNGAIRLFPVRGKGECVTTIDLAAAWGGSLRNASERGNPIAAKLLFKTEVDFYGRRREVNAVRAADVLALCSIHKPTPDLRRTAQLFASYNAGLAQTYVPSLPAPRQPELPFQETPSLT